MEDLLSKSISQLMDIPEYSHKLNAYLSVDKIHSLIRPVSKIKLKHLCKIPISFLRETIDMLIDFVTLDNEPIKADDERSIKLWSRPPCHIEGEKTPYIIPFLLNRPAPLIIIAPGGSYSNVSLEHEGLQVAEALNEQGFHALVLNYRVSPSRYPSPQLDLIRAMQIAKSLEQEWRILPNQTALMGFSAGGHLCSSTAALYKELIWQSGKLKHLKINVDALVLAYPQINLCFKVMNTPSGVFLLNSNTAMNEYRRLSTHNLVRSDYPPTFLWSEAGDPFVKVSENSELLRIALQREGVPYEYKLYEGDEHGGGLALGRPAEPWFMDAINFLKKHGFSPNKKAKVLANQQ